MVSLTRTSALLMTTCRQAGRFDTNNRVLRSSFCVSTVSWTSFWRCRPTVFAFALCVCGGALVQAPSPDAPHHRNSSDPSWPCRFDRFLCKPAPVVGYITPAPAVLFVIPASAVKSAPGQVVDNIEPSPFRQRKRSTTSSQRQVVGYITPTPAVSHVVSCDRRASACGLSFQSNSALDGFVDQITATTVARNQFQPIVSRIDQFTDRENIFRDSSDLQSNTTICCTAWWRKCDVQHICTKVVDHMFRDVPHLIGRTDVLRCPCPNMNSHRFSTFKVDGCTAIVQRSSLVNAATEDGATLLALD